ncbi:MAG: hypothetical protein K2H53_07220, partial [Clostridia bacterium]|nr:hypothetical protein [Clostridia bacterium]
LIVYNIAVSKKIKNFKDINQKVTSLNVLQDFMTTIGDNASVDEKIVKINEILIEQYAIKYSTIVVFDGAEYVVKASNVDKKHWDTLRNLQNEEIFKDSITTTKPKYVTVNNEEERLPYQKMEFGRAKSAMFFPLYIDNVYIGYWIIESGRMHAFDHIDTTILEVVKDNIISIFRIVSYQNIIESLTRKDLYSDLKTSEYLYEEGRNIIDSYTTSTICMFKIANLEETNNKVNRDTGNQMIIDVCDYIKDKLSDEYVFVRYMGPKFVIAFSGVEVDGTSEFLNDLKRDVEGLEVEDVIATEENEKENTKKKKKVIITNPKLNIVLTSYYKGTALEKVLKKLEEYLDSADKSESDINNI